MGCGQSKFTLLCGCSQNSQRDPKPDDAVEANDSDEEENVASITPEESELGIHQEETSVDVSEDITPVSSRETQTSQDVLPISEHQPTFEVPLNQKTFFQMLDEKIALGNDYDSSSEKEIQEKEERTRKIIELWNSYSQSGQAVPLAAPPTPPTNRLTRSVSRISHRQCTPITGNKCYQNSTSPPTRRHGVHTYYDPSSSSPCPSTINQSDRNQQVKYSAGRKKKVISMPKQKGDPVAGSSTERTMPTHSSTPHIVSRPLTQRQQAAPVTPARFIAPPDEYKDSDITRIQKTLTVSHSVSQAYIHGNDAATASHFVQQQRTAQHLQCQQQVSLHTSCMKRSPNVVFPGADLRTVTPRMQEGEELAAMYGYNGPRPQTAPGRTGTTEVAHVNTPTWNTLPPVMTTQWPGGEVPIEMQYYPQSQFVTRQTVQVVNVKCKPVGQIVAVGGQELAVSTEEQIVAANGQEPSESSAVGQIVVAGQKELTVSITVSDTASPAAVSTDSGGSPGTSAPMPKGSSANKTTPEPKSKSKTKRTLSKSLDA